MTTTMTANGNAFSFPVRIYYEDTDAGGVVYHANYLNFFERARTEWLRSVGYEQDELRKIDKIIFAVRHIEISYLKPAVFNDQLIVSVKLISNRGCRIEVEQQIIRKGEGGDNTVLSIGKVQVVCVDANTFRPKKIPNNMLADLY
jgi:acyl-CoA thioester hydrolase